jgi:serine/threonine protein kinase
MELAPNAEIAGRYRVVRTLGRGGMGIVYEVEHHHTGQHLALKVLISTHGLPQGVGAEAIERFKREARASGKIKSEHVVRITDADAAPELDGAPFLVMELLEGTDLGAITDDKPASRADVVNWLRQAARGLSRAHALGIVHRDLKPENIFLTHRDDGSPLVKVLDFGIAKTLADASVQTQSGQIIGTPMYMAPEQALAGTAPITTKTDLYALGLIAFRLLTGQYFWRDGSLASLVAQILYNPIEPPSKRFPALGAEFDAWFLRACAREPAERFDSAPEQIEALAKALGVAVHESEPGQSGKSRVVVPIEPSALGMAKTFDVSTPVLSVRSAPAGTLDSSASAISAAAPAPRRTGRFVVIGFAIATIVTGTVILVNKSMTGNVSNAANPSASPSGGGAASVAATQSPAPTPSPTASSSVVAVTSAAASAPAPSVLAPIALVRPPTSTGASTKPSASSAPAPSPSPTVAASVPPPKPSAKYDPKNDEQK